MAITPDQLQRILESFFSPLKYATKPAPVEVKVEVKIEIKIDDKKTTEKENTK